MDRILDILKKGIEAKRQGDYKRALDCYSKAQEIDPLDSRSYGNSMKVFIGTGQYELAFRQLLLICHFNIIQDLFSQDMMAEEFYQQFLPRFKWSSNELTDSNNFEPQLVYEGLKKNPLLKDLIYRADNLTFYVGHCYVGEFKDKDSRILAKFGTYSHFFDNLNNGVLGKPSGQDFRDTPQEGYFLSIGFIYAHMNLNFSLKTKQNIVDYYMNPNTKIRKDIWNYRQFLQSIKGTALNADSVENKVAKNIALKIEQQFNTKVFRFGVARKGTKEFESLTPFRIVAPKGADLLFWFLVPIDDADNIITNNYYEKSQKLNEYGLFSSLSFLAQHEFQSILKQDWDLSNYLQQLIGCQVYDTGSMKVEKYSSEDNIVPNADKIEDLRYRFFRFYAPQLG